MPTASLHALILAADEVSVDGHNIEDVTGPLKALRLDSGGRDWFVLDQQVELDQDGRCVAKDEYGEFLVITLTMRIVRPMTLADLENQ